uniref:Uncharacterized protein n=1 Tax=Arundo donax TaxID=35708 RepID=A0A0A8YSE1_ARUDO
MRDKWVTLLHIIKWRWENELHYYYITLWYTKTIFTF